MYGGMYYGQYWFGVGAPAAPPILPTGTCLTAEVTVQSLVTSSAIDCSIAVVEADVVSQLLATAEALTTNCGCPAGCACHND